MGCGRKGNGSDSKSEILSSNLSTPTNNKNMIFNKESIKTIDNIPGIYLIKNKVNGKCYIGQSIRLRKRLLHHLNNYINDRYDFPLYRAFDKYGTDNFEVFILNSFNSTNYTEIKKELDILEIKYIKEYNSYGTTGYNQTYGGDAGVLGYKMTEEQKDKIKNNVKSANEDGRYLVYCFDVLDKVYYIFINRTKLSEYLKCCLNRGEGYKLQHKRYLVASTKEALQEMINIYNDKVLNGTINQ